MKQRRTHSASFKAEVCLDIITRKYTLSEAAKQYGIAQEIIIRWKNKFIKDAYLLFERPSLSQMKQKYDKLLQQHNKVINKDNFLRKLVNNTKNEYSINEICNILGIDHNIFYAKAQEEYTQKQYLETKINMCNLYLFTRFHTLNHIGYFFNLKDISINYNCINAAMKEMEMLPATLYNQDIPNKYIKNDFSVLEDNAIIIDFLPSYQDNQILYNLVIIKLDGTVLHYTPNEYIEKDRFDYNLKMKLPLFKTKLQESKDILFRRKSLVYSLKNHLNKLGLEPRYILRGSLLDNNVSSIIRKEWLKRLS